MASKRDAVTGTKASADVLVVAIVIYDPNRRQPANDFDVYTERSPRACVLPHGRLVAAWTPHGSLAIVLRKPPDDA